MTASADPDWQDTLNALADQSLRRRLREVDSAQGPYVTIDGRRLCCLCSNNYLDLANHSHVIKSARQAIDEWGFGSGASRLVSGHMTPHARLEQRLATFKGTEAALVCNSGHQANLIAIHALAEKNDVILLDKLNHASIIDAAKSSPATVRVYPHRDYSKLERLLQRTQDARRRIIITDTVFSMDGDFADLPRLVELKRQYDALLCIDEAHATGVIGEHGKGLAELMAVESDIDVTVGTLSKALGGMGGFIAGSRALIDWIVNTGRAFIYTTALPAVACEAASAALDVVEREPERREHLAALGEHLRYELHDVRGYDIGDTACHIIPLIVGDAADTVALSNALESQGFLVPAIRPPTVPRGKARLRISLSAAHTEDDINQLLACLDQSTIRPSERV